METKYCTRCSENKILSEFPKNKSKKSGYNSTCKVCMKELHRERYRKDPEKENNRRRKNYLQNTYGLSLEDYDRKHEQQAGACAICGGVNASGRRLSVDHSHTTGKIRSLLCDNCNIALGHVKDDERILLRMVQYLREWED